MPEINTDITKAARDIANVAKDATYVVIGAGVLGFQKAQVQRQELLKRLAESKVDGKSRLRSAHIDLNGAIHGVDAKVEELIARVEAAVLPLEDRLPDPARNLARQAHVQAKEARSQLRDRILTTAG